MQVDLELLSYTASGQAGYPFDQLNAYRVVICGTL